MGVVAEHYLEEVVHVLVCEAHLRVARSNIVVFATVFPPSLTLLPMAVTDVNCGALHSFRQPELEIYLAPRERLVEEVEDDLVGEPLVVRLGVGVGAFLLGEDTERLG